MGALCPLPAFDKFLTCNSPLAPAASFLPYMGKNHAWFPTKPLMDRLSAQTASTKTPVLIIFFRHTEPSRAKSTKSCISAVSRRTAMSK